MTFVCLYRDDFTLPLIERSTSICTDPRMNAADSALSAEALLLLSRRRDDRRGRGLCRGLGARARERHHRFRPRRRRIREKHSMGKTFVLTVDVEIDAGPKWRTSNPATYEGVHVGIASLQRLCDAYGVKPVYLISPAVMVDARAV